MTTVVCNTTEMACDLQMTNAGWLKWKCKTKIFKLNGNEYICPDNYLVGFAGTAGDMMDIVDYLSHPEAYKHVPKFNTEGLVLTERGVIYHFTKPDKWYMIDEPYAGIGSGSPIAIGALTNGASPKEAVRAAMKHDAFTGLGVKSYSWE